MRTQPRTRGIQPELSTHHPMGISHRPKKIPPTLHSAPLTRYSCCTPTAASPNGSAARSTAVPSNAALQRITTALTRPKAAMPKAATWSVVRKSR